MAAILWYRRLMDTSPRRLSLMLAAARAAVLWERALERFFPALLIAGVGLIVLKTGVLGALPTWLRWPAASLLALALLAALTRGVRLKLPGDRDAARWLDTRNPNGERAAEAFLDTLPAAAAGEGPRALWQAHRDRLSRTLAAYRLGLPRSPLRDLDPFAVRNAVALALSAAFMAGSAPLGLRVAELSHDPAAAAVADSLDVWVTPPAYTGRPPVLLAGPARVRSGGSAEADADADGQPRAVAVPEGSKLTARISGADAPALRLVPLDAAGTAIAPPVDTAFKLDDAGKGEVQAVLDRGGRIEVVDGRRVVGAWTVSVIDDKPPQVSVATPVEVTARGQIAINWQASDDYGVAGGDSSVTLAPAAGPPAGNAAGDPAPEVDPSSPFLAEPPAFVLALQALNPKQAKGRAFQDLTAHHWAGLEVELTLTAADQAGQKSASAPVRLRLPERQFSVPLAAAIAEQRMALIRTPAKQRQVVRTLAALMAWPDDIFPTSGAFLAVRDAGARLHVAQTTDEVKGVIDKLWQIAIGLEDGSLDQARKALEEARRELQQAIAEGAPPEKIEELTRKLREAMNRYLEAMAEQMMERMRRGDAPQNQQQAVEQLRQQDLDRMLDQIENLARSGSRDAAQELLAQLENMLNNLQMQMGQQGQQGQQGDQDGQMGQMMNQLGQMMRDQQRLMDETFRMPGGEGMPQDGQRGEMPGQQPGQPGQRGQGRGGDQLSQDQQGLGEALREMMRQMGEMGMGALPGMNRAGRAMDEAADALGRGDRDGALESQNDALQALRDGARQMAEQMAQQQGQGSEGRFGRNGRARGDDRDPLGRPMRRDGELFGPNEDMVPGEAAVERARRILEYLRNRAGETNRPQIELDYFERLLRGLY